MQSNYCIIWQKQFFFDNSKQKNSEKHIYLQAQNWYSLIKIA